MGLRETLRQEAEAFKRLAELNGMRESRQGTLQEAILKHGEIYELDREASAARGPGILKNCYENAAQASLWDDEFTYVEGFASRPPFNMPIHHAWVINAEGKVLEVTWRDGGSDCGHCVDGQREIEVDEDDEDYDDKADTTETCPYCGGSGESDSEHSSLEGAQYMGIAVDSGTLSKIINRNKLWGALHSAEDLRDVLAAKR